MEGNRKHPVSLLHMLPLLGSRLIHWGYDFIGSDDVRGYQRIHYRSQAKLRKHARQRSN